jgi:hypothetical protein
MPVRLALTRARPEIAAMNDERLFLFVAEFVDDGGAALLSERRIGQTDFVFAMLRSQRVLEHLYENNSG